MNATMQSDSSSNQEWQWPDSLDALIAAPDHHELLFENDRVRVLNTSIPAGGRVPVHTHRWPSVLYILSWSDFLRYNDNDEVVLDSRTVDALKNPPAVVWSSPLPPHSLQNIGEMDLNIIAVELKDNTA